MRICRRVAKRLASVRPLAPGRDLIRGFCESKPDRLARLQKHRTYGAGMFENSETSPCAMVGGVIVAPRNPVYGMPALMGTSRAVSSAATIS